MINTDCVKVYNEVQNQVRDHVWINTDCVNTDCVNTDYVELYYEVSIQVRDQVWGYLYSLIRYEVRLKVWFD